MRRSAATEQRGPKIYLTLLGSLTPVPPLSPPTPGPPGTCRRQRSTYGDRPRLAYQIFRSGV
eukprot:768178-Hanusia_phi.AAC.1